VRSSGVDLSHGGVDPARVNTSGWGYAQRGLAAEGHPLNKVDSRRLRGGTQLTS